MHEVGLCEAVLAVVREVTDDAPVTRVRVGVGRMRAVVPASFELGWQLVTEGTGAAGSRVEVVPLGGDELVVEEVELAGGETRRNPQLESQGRS